MQKRKSDGRSETGTASGKTGKASGRGRAAAPGAGRGGAGLDSRIAKWRTEGISRVKLALTDIDGVMRGKYISLDKFASVAESGGAFCDCVLGWDVVDRLYDNAT